MMRSSVALALSFVFAAAAGAAEIETYTANVFIDSRGPYVLIAMDDGNAGKEPAGYAEETFTIGLRSPGDVHAKIANADVEITSDTVVIIARHEKAAYVFSLGNPDRTFPSEFRVTSVTGAFQIARHQRHRLTMGAVVSETTSGPQTASGETGARKLRYAPWWDVAANGSNAFDCHSGGEGATVCSQGTSSSEPSGIPPRLIECSAACGSGYHACCSASATNCRCIPDAQQK